MPEARPRDDVDPYANDIHRWWHLSEPCPELIDALEQHWLTPPGRVLDLGCGLGTEAAFLSSAGFTVIGVDLSAIAVQQSQLSYPETRFLQANAANLPFDSSVFDVLVDRGCFHYLTPIERIAYAGEARRVLKTHGRLFLRACLRNAGYATTSMPKSSGGSSQGGIRCDYTKQASPAIHAAWMRW